MRVGINVWRPVEHALSGAARVAWPVLQSLNQRFPAKTFQPAWAPGPLLKSSERTKPALGWPRRTDSLCPQCVKVTRQRILSGEQSIESLVDDHTGEITAHILERDGKVVIEKTCPTHGTFTDTLAIDPAFLDAHREPVSRPRFQGRRTRPPRSRHIVHSARPRRGAHDRSHQPLQHDVRSMFHGRESGRLRP